jgi:TDG/mug DNA glycosylase family protein
MATRIPILPDRLKPGLRLVFCGTAAGKQSALKKAYYANRQNKFWRTLHQIGLTPRQFEPHEFPQLWELGIGLTDIAKYHFGMDHQLPKESLGQEAVADLRARIARAAPRHLAFTSLNAGRSVLGKSAVAGQQREKWGETRVWILPSPSPLADNHWDIAPWQDLALALTAFSARPR